jgi:dihydrofolate synthase/folylpolyglutamate synthase
MQRHDYASAERFLLSREFFGLKLGLENITEFLHSIGAPQQRYPTIHIAGTNGKGSVAAMLAYVMRTQGHKTGLFTSPHLVSFRERVQVDGRPIPGRSLVSFVDRHRPELVRRKLSFFEVVTAMAFEHFARVGADIAIIETGLGGRFDATNVLTPLVTITTDISRDHMEILGNTLPKIAFEKAGIIKTGVPHVSGFLPESAEKVIRRACRERGAPYHRLLSKEFQPFVHEMKLGFASNGFSIAPFQPGLYGEHQLRNCAVALKALSVLRQNGWPVSMRAIRNGLANTRWPGRFQIIRRPNQPDLLFDVGHNAGGIAAFVKAFQNHYPGRKAHVITGFVKRKEHQKMFDALRHITREYHLVPLKTHRSTDVDQLISQINWRAVPIRRCAGLRSAYNKLAKACSHDDIIAVVGSHYLVGEFFQAYGIR